MRVRSREVDKSIEELAITGMIVSDEFLKHTFKATNHQTFPIDVLGVFGVVCIDYFQTNSGAPGEDIYEVFKLHESSLDPDEARVVQKHLDKILNMYDEKNFNAKYIAGKVLPYLEANAVEKLAEEMLILVRRGETQKAKHLRENGLREVFHQTSQVTDVFSPEFIDVVFDEKAGSLFEFGGALGKYLAPLKRGKLIAFLGPPKRGKSFWLIEWAFQALFSGLKVMFFSLEMSESEVNTRFVKRAKGCEIYDPNTTKKRTYQVPVMDCVHNQTGECQRKERKGEGRVLNSSDEPESYEKHSDHIPCTVCRGNKTCYEPSSWVIDVKKRLISKKEAKKLMKRLKRDSSGGSLRIKTFPIRTASVTDLESVLDDLEILDNWVPDVVVVDYAGIVKEDFKVSSEKRHRVGAIWEELSRVAKSRNIQLVTAGQGNREARNKDFLESTDMAEDWSIVMTVDTLIAINERGQETRDKEKKDKFWKRQYIEILEHRDKEVLVSVSCLTLNHLGLGQVCLDSEII